MSVFDALKGRLSSVQNDISSGLKTLTSPSKNKRVRQTSVRTYDVNLDAGADLLNRFQQNWSDIHKASEQNAKRAEVVRKEVMQLCGSVETQNKAMNTLVALIGGMPQLLSDLKTVASQIDAMSDQLSEVDRLMATLEDLTEQQEMSANKLHHEYQLSIYRQRKNVDLEKIKVKLAKEHVEKVRGYEAKLQKLLQEKQQAFEETFTQEIENYKKYGKTNMKPLLSGAALVDVADITLDEDTHALEWLDEFLDAPSGETSGEQMKVNTDDIDIDEEEQERLKKVASVVEEEQDQLSTKSDTTEPVVDDNKNVMPIPDVRAEKEQNPTNTEAITPEVNPEPAEEKT